MPPPKKAAKKAALKTAPTRDEAKDFRRAHEHGGRIDVLRSALGKNTGDIDTLANLAEQELADSHPADLLRAAEHLGFGYLASSKPDEHLHPKLSEGIEEEFQHKMEKAEEHWEKPEVLSSLYRKTLDSTRKAFDDGAYRKALELVRAAEAMAHVHLHAVGKE